MTVIGKDKLGFKVKDIDNLLVIYGASMVMFLDNVPIFLFMLSGRWSSGDFLEYTRN